MVPRVLPVAEPARLQGASQGRDHQGRSPRPDGGRALRREGEGGPGCVDGVLGGVRQLPVLVQHDLRRTAPVGACEPALRAQHRVEGYDGRHSLRQPGWLAQQLSARDLRATHREGRGRLCRRVPSDGGRRVREGTKHVSRGADALRILPRPGPLRDGPRQRRQGGDEAFREGGA